MVSKVHEFLNCAGLLICREEQEIMLKTTHTVYAKVSSQQTSSANRKSANLINNNVVICEIAIRRHTSFL
jgi:hypothetical protein